MRPISASDLSSSTNKSRLSLSALRQRHQHLEVNRHPKSAVTPVKASRARRDGAVFLRAESQPPRHVRRQAYCCRRRPVSKNRRRGFRYFRCSGDLIRRSNVVRREIVGTPKIQYSRCTPFCYPSSLDDGRVIRSGGTLDRAGHGPAPTVTKLCSRYYFVHSQNIFMIKNLYNTFTMITIQQLITQKLNIQLLTTMFRLQTSKQLSLCRCRLR